MELSSVPVERDVPFRNHSTLRIGPTIGRLFQPASLEDVQTLVSEGIGRHWIGQGSNILPLSSLEGADIVKIGASLGQFRFDGSRLWAQAGVLMAKLLKESIKLGLSGLEMSTTVPTTLGGGLVMNFGAYGQELKDVVRWVRVVDADGQVLTLDRDACEFAYRNSVFQRLPYKIVDCELDLIPIDSAELQRRVDGYGAKRKVVTPPFPNAGSVFKNPPGQIAGKIIQDLGLRGFRVGDGGIWEGHGNYLINYGQATPEECIAVLEHVEGAVLRETGIVLVREVRVLA